MQCKIVSLNLWLGGVLGDGIVTFLREQDADIVLLQEVYNGTDPELAPQYRSMQLLGEKLGYPHSDFVADFLDHAEAKGKAHRGNAILSKYELTTHPPLYFNEPYSEEYLDVEGNYQLCPRDLQHVTAQTPVGAVDIFNIQGSWDVEGDNASPERWAMSEAVLNATKGLKDVILGGDTNARPTNPVIKAWEPQLKSVFGSSLKSTFNMRRKHDGGYATSVVDMIFVSPHIEVVNKDCPDIDISDHLPLVATVSFS